MNEELEETEGNKSSDYWNIIKECKLLYRQANFPMTQTCMCWGIDCGPGWYKPIERLSYHLEAINYEILPKLGFVIEAEQVKEKFGTLRFSFTVRKVPSLWRRILAAPFMWLGVTKIDATGFEEKIADALSNFFFTIGNRIIAGSRNRQIKNKVIWSAIYDYVDTMIKECDEECQNVCEHCGRHFGLTPRCQPKGQYSYLCENCAIKGKYHYQYVLRENEKEEFKKYIEFGDEKTKEVLKNLGKDMYDGKPYVQSIKQEDVPEEQEDAVTKAKVKVRKPKNKTSITSKKKVVKKAES